MTSILEPVCPKKSFEIKYHDRTFEDPYHWLNQRDSPEVLAYLKAENDYFQQSEGHLQPFREELFEEMKGRIVEDDSSVPYFEKGYWYYTRFEKGKDYPFYCRKKEGLDNPETILLDVNTLAEGKSYCQVGSIAVSPDGEWLLYGVDFVSRRQYDLHLLHIPSGKLHPWTVKNTAGSGYWSADSQTLLYTAKDPETLRTDKIIRANPFLNQEEIIFEELDETFYTFCYTSLSGKYFIIGSESTLTSEYQLLERANAHGSLHVFHPRERGLEYDIEHRGDGFIIRSNKDDQINFALYACPELQTHKAHWKPFETYKPDVLTEGVLCLSECTVIMERVTGAQRFRIKDHSGREQLVQLPETSVSLGFGKNPTFDTSHFRFSYTSLTTPPSTMELDLKSMEVKTLKEQMVLGGFDKSLYVSERIMLPSRDGHTEIPVSLVYRKDLKQEGNPLLLYGYGSYGYSMDPYFSSARLSLLDRGFIYAIAHIRGGEDLGRQWYEDGRQLKKKNTFFDFIDAGKGLFENKWVKSGQLYAMGGSAGGLLMGAVMNMEPQLFHGIVASVPFVDVIHTMMDETLPLTTGEYDEWGNPNEPKFFDYILEYSPYDNVQKQDYPHLLITTGYHDSQVQYWEPAKWIAQLRAHRTNQNKLYLHTDMEAGHGGPSGRFTALKEVALEYSFLLELAGLV